MLLTIAFLVGMLLTTEADKPLGSSRRGRFLNGSLLRHFLQLVDVSNSIENLKQGPLITHLHNLRVQPRLRARISGVDTPMQLGENRPGSRYVF
jgi:hypothetical protein